MQHSQPKKKYLLGAGPPSGATLVALAASASKTDNTLSFSCSVEDSVRSLENVVIKQYQGTSEYIASGILKILKGDAPPDKVPESEVEAFLKDDSTLLYRINCGDDPTKYTETKHAKDIDKKLLGTLHKLVIRAKDAACNRYLAAVLVEHLPRDELAVAFPEDKRTDGRVGLANLTRRFAGLTDARVQVMTKEYLDTSWQTERGVAITDLFNAVNRARRDLQRVAEASNSHAFVLHITTIAYAVKLVLGAIRKGDPVLDNVIENVLRDVSILEGHDFTGQGGTVSLACNYNCPRADYANFVTKTTGPGVVTSDLSIHFYEVVKDYIHRRSVDLKLAERVNACRTNLINLYKNPPKTLKVEPEREEAKRERTTRRKDKDITCFLCEGPHLLHKKHDAGKFKDDEWKKVAQGASQVGPYKTLLQEITEWPDKLDAIAERVKEKTKRELRGTWAAWLTYRKTRAPAKTGMVTVDDERQTSTIEQWVRGGDDC